ncbi:winged helix-turn-helix domain-containing protein [Aliiroseovarius sp. KMU-50]|uniref:Winged helix-turn-helix domain-containing protein n=1 Tax=Aliiroseovarius salicola TaxID=3009082 RepID=A0ABT4VZP9_9RHOB|nr:winged helix-turn-helix domain-containing protein [Aliiroseovarius sp. KMU-50]MDA5093735.1 winged helix-turn-helix domain-containing protein [Aliiroseovarius sp. KMU-50]
MILAIGDIEIDSGKGEVRRNNVALRMAPRVMSLLHLLAENSERMVTKDEIIDKIWDGRAISDSAISTSIKEARQAIGDDGQRQAIIKTIHGLGFRCVADVRLVAPADPARIPDTQLLPEEQELDARLLGKPSVAVLPFANVAADGMVDPFGDGLAAELISALSRLSFVSVTSRGSSFRFRQLDPDLSTIARMLKVKYCLFGIIERSEREIAVTVELARTSDGVVIWSDRIVGVPDGIHDIRQEIVGEVIAALEIHIPLSEAQSARLIAPDKLDAWAEYHIGLQHLYRFNPRDNEIAKGRFTRATALEPGFARAMAGLSFVEFQNVFMGYGPDLDRHKQKAMAYAEKSLELDMLDPFGNYCMGRANWMNGDLEAANLWLGRSLEISPNFAQGHYLRSLVRVLQGEGEAIRKENNLAMTLSPLDPLRYAMLGTHAQSYINDGQYEEAAVWGERSAQTPGSHYLLSMLAAAAYQLKGDHIRAQHWVDVTRSRRPDASVERFLEAFQYQSETSRKRLEKALNDAGY